MLSSTKTHALLQDGLTRLLEAHGCEVVAAVDNARRCGVRSTSTIPTSLWWTYGYRRRHRRGPAGGDRGARAAAGLPILVLSQYVEQLYARELLESGEGGVGYLLKDRVADVRPSSMRSDGSPAAARPRPGGRVDPAEPARRRLARRPADPARARGAGADGRGAIERSDRCALFVTEKAVSKHTNNIFAKLGLPVRGRQPPRARGAGLPRRLARAHQRHSQTGSISCSSSGRPWDSRSVTRCPSLRGERTAYAGSSTSPRS